MGFNNIFSIFLNYSFCISFHLFFCSPILSLFISYFYHYLYKILTILFILCSSDVLFVVVSRAALVVFKWFYKARFYVFDTIVVCFSSLNNAKDWTLKWSLRHSLESRKHSHPERHAILERKIQEKWKICHFDSLKINNTVETDSKDIKMNKTSNNLYFKLLINEKGI